MRLNVRLLNREAEERVVTFSGRAVTSFAAPCVRCLENVASKIEADLSAALFEKSESVSEKEAWEGDADAVADGFFENEEVDLPGIIRELVLLETDPNPLCKDQRACSARTASLIARANQPAEEVDFQTHPLAALKDHPLAS